VIQFMLFQSLTQLHTNASCADMQTVVMVVKIPKTEFLAKESQFKQAAATAGRVDVSKVKFVSVEEIGLRCILVSMCIFTLKCFRQGVRFEDSSDFVLRIVLI